MLYRVAYWSLLRCIAAVKPGMQSRGCVKILRSWGKKEVGAWVDTLAVQ
jgi:hypothetical protein